MSWSCSSSNRELPACCRVAILVRVAMDAGVPIPTLQPWEGPEGVCGFTWSNGEKSVNLLWQLAEQIRTTNRQKCVVKNLSKLS